MKRSTLPLMIDRIKIFCASHAWLRRSAIQQGAMFVTVSIVSLLLISSITISYVDYHLDEVNDEIEQSIEAFMYGTTTDIDKEPIDEDDVIDALVTGFTLSGLLVVLLSAVIVAYMSKRNQEKIDCIERVLKLAAEGNLSARTAVSRQDNDLDLIGCSVDDMLSQLQSVVAAMSDISTNIAHELKTPITRLQYHLHILSEMLDQKNTVDDHSVSEQLALATKESTRLAETFDALLRISQIESGQRRQRFESVDIVDVVNTIADIYVDVADDAGMVLNVHTPKLPLVIQGDRELLIQQLANLVENALRYCPKGSELALICRGGNKHIMIEMKDNGPGIPEQEKERVFERLYRINKARNDGGLGIGLSLVKAVAELHKGDVKLYDCHPGLGVNIYYQQ
ncbi:sensor histidine kinase [Photobacterium leiognathi]|uniref:sensor histidine kinase n=1 Tax=Photobacterium leiognathi TaxID=553611 RepID=UPI00273A04B3|nr:HAMP domain-containing sensor histidine kinase [Photobacterium leiognathi]